MKKIIILLLPLILIACNDKICPAYADLYAEWKAEQKQNTANALTYSQSTEFKRIYGGTSTNQFIIGVTATNVINTDADPFYILRNSSTIPILSVPKDYHITLRH